MDIGDLSDHETQELIKKLSKDVQKKEERAQSLKDEVQVIQDEIQRHQQERSEFTKQLFKAEEVAPLVEQSLQIRGALEKKRSDYGAIIQGKSRSCIAIQQLERELSEVESGSRLRKMEAENKENIACVQELKTLYGLRQQEHQELKDKLTHLQCRVTELSRLQAQRRLKKLAVSSQRQDIDGYLDRFIRKTCQECGLQLHHTDSGTQPAS